MIWLIDLCDRKPPQKLNKVRRIVRAYLGARPIYRHYSCFKRILLGKNDKIVFLIAGYDPRGYINKLSSTGLPDKFELYVFNVECNLMSLRSKNFV
jgi:hypothetical protein